MVKRIKTQGNSISGVLPGLLRQRGWEYQLDLHSIFPRWQELVGEEMCEHARPLKIEKEVLWLEVDNSSWMQQFQYEKMELLEALNKVLRISRIKDIKMTLPKGKGVKAGPPGRKSGPAIEFVRPSEDKVAAFQRQVECIADEKCREALMQFWYLAQACKRKKE